MGFGLYVFYLGYFDLNRRYQLVDNLCCFTFAPLSLAPNASSGVHRPRPSPSYVNSQALRVSPRVSQPPVTSSTPLMPLMLRMWGQAVLGVICLQEGLSTLDAAGHVAVSIIAIGIGSLVVVLIGYYQGGNCVDMVGILIRS